MHPAYSIIWFTSLSGAGYGLAAVLGLGITPVEGGTAVAAYGAAMALITVGLLTSTIHLGHPERAWMALSQWRSSWLSREGVLAVATFVPLAICAIWAVQFGRHPTIAGILLAVLCGGTVFSTSMIYASLRTIHQWHSWLTSACYLAFAASSGVLLANAIVRLTPGTDLTGFIAMTLLTVAWIFKAMWWRRADLTSGLSTAHSALGLLATSNPHPLEAPHTGTNYLLDEMGYRVGRKHGQILRAFALGFGLVLPMPCLAASVVLDGIAATGFASLAAASHFAGIVIERWLFFAQAKHPVMLYYEAVPPPPSASTQNGWFARRD